MSIRTVRTYTCDQCKKEATIDNFSRDDNWHNIEMKVNNGADAKDQEKSHVCGFECAQKAMIEYQQQKGTIKWVKMDSIFF